MHFLGQKYFFTNNNIATGETSGASSLSEVHFFGYFNFFPQPPLSSSSAPQPWQKVSKPWNSYNMPAERSMENLESFWGILELEWNPEIVLRGNSFQVQRVPPTWSMPTVWWAACAACSSSCIAWEEQHVQVHCSSSFAVWVSGQDCAALWRCCSSMQWLMIQTEFLARVHPHNRPHSALGGALQRALRCIGQTAKKRWSDSAVQLIGECTTKVWAQQCQAVHWKLESGAA